MCCLITVFTPRFLRSDGLSVLTVFVVVSEKEAYG